MDGGSKDPSMRKLSITELAEVAEVVAGVGVLLSLLYVGFEIRQNTTAVRSTAYQAIHDAEDGFWSDQLIDRRLSDAALSAPRSGRAAE
jgi:hypothetical protein